jgi:type IV pilus assembly protein PilW
VRKLSSKKPSSRSQQRGITLIELMIAIALSMTLMAAALQFMVSTRQTYELNDDISRVQENGRIALDMLVKDLQMAGYRQPLNGDGKVPDFFLQQCNNTAADDDTAADDNAPCFVEGGAADSDEISVQFDPPPDDGTETDCLGTALAATAIVVNHYTIGDDDGDGINSLYCRGYDSAAESWVSPGRQPLVDGIDNMQVLYGVAGSAANPLSVTKYISGDQLTPADWPNLRAIRVALLVSNGNPVAFAENRERKYRLLDSDELVFTDRQPRKIYSTTVKFNNYGAL